MVLLIHNCHFGYPITIDRIFFDQVQICLSLHELQGIFKIHVLFCIIKVTLMDLSQQVEVCNKYIIYLQGPELFVSEFLPLGVITVFEYVFGKKLLD